MFKNVFFHNRQSHIFARKRRTTEIKHDLELSVLCLFKTVYSFIHLTRIPTGFYLYLIRIGNEGRVYNSPPPPLTHVFLKVVGNEKLGGSGVWLLIE